MILHISADFFQRSSVLDYSCNSPMPCNPADSKQPLLQVLQYLGMPHLAVCNSPILHRAPCPIASSWRGKTFPLKAATRRHRGPQAAPTSKPRWTQILLKAIKTKESQWKQLPYASVCNRKHSYGAYGAICNQDIQFNVYHVAKNINKLQKTPKLLLYQ